MQVPSEILLKIFENVDQSDVMNIMMTSRRFRSLVERNRTALPRGYVDVVFDYCKAGAGNKEAKYHIRLTNGRQTMCFHISSKDVMMHDLFDGKPSSHIWTNATKEVESPRLTRSNRTVAPGLLIATENGELMARSLIQYIFRRIHIKILTLNDVDNKFQTDLLNAVIRCKLKAKSINFARETEINRVVQLCNALDARDIQLWPERRSSSNIKYYSTLLANLKICNIRMSHVEVVDLETFKVLIGKWLKSDFKNVSYDFFIPKLIILEEVLKDFKAEINYGTHYHESFRIIRDDGNFMRINKLYCAEINKNIVRLEDKFRMQCTRISHPFF